MAEPGFVLPIAQGKQERFDLASDAGMSSLGGSVLVDEEFLLLQAAQAATLDVPAFPDHVPSLGMPSGYVDPHVAIAAEEARLEAERVRQAEMHAEHEAAVYQHQELLAEAAAGGPPSPHYVFKFGRKHFNR